MLIGVGLGPGSPDLMTLASIKALKTSRKVFVPGKLAAELVAPYAESEILDFPMILDKTELSRLWEKNAGIVADEAGKGTVSFAVLGDPNFFSTFSHLRRKIKENYPEIEITTIPGVSAITAQAARTDAAIEGSFIVSDGSPVRTGIFLKAKDPEKKKKELMKEGFNEFVHAERLFMDVFEMKDEVVEADACKMEHILSEELTDSVCTFLGHPPTCPHGKAIPKGECCKKYKLEVTPVVARLSDFEVGSKGRIVFIIPSEAARLGRLGSVGIAPGSTIKLLQKMPSCVIQIDETTIALDLDIAREILVKKIV